MTEKWDRIRELAKLVETEYKRISFINSEKRILEPVNRELTVDYVQLAYKFIMPSWLFEDNVSIEQIASEYANGLMRSELRYLIKKMNESQKSRTIYSITDINYNELRNHFLSLKNATDLFIPDSIVYNYFYSFRNQNPYFRLEGEYIRMKNKSLRLHISNRYLPFDKILVLDYSGVDWSQKRVRNMTISQAKDPRDLKHLTTEDDILQISAKINDDDSVLFLMRLVVGVLINPEKVRMIDVSKKLLEEQI